MKIYGLSDRGMVRKDNQDSYICEDNELFSFGFVCDGMGGAAAGGKASQIAIKCIGESVKPQIEKDMTAADIKSVLRSAVRLANERIFNEAQANPEFKGMGTTAVGFLHMKNTGAAAVVNVGDSRAYLIKENTIKQITSDHSLVNELIQKGTLTPQEAKTHPHRNIITRAVGTTDSVHPDTFDLELEKGSVILLCSDGLTNMMSDEEILSKVSMAGDIESMVAELINRANMAGGYDNITALAAVLDDEGGVSA